MVLPSFGSLLTYFFCQVSITSRYWSCTPNKRHLAQGAERPTEWLDYSKLDTTCLLSRDSLVWLGLVIALQEFEPVP